MYHSVPVFLRACFNPWQFFQCVTGTQRNDRVRFGITDSVVNVWTPLRTDRVKCYTLYFLCQSTTRKRKLCCDLPKQSTFHLLNLCLPYSNSSPHNNALYTHRLILSFTDDFLCRLATPWKLKIAAPKAAATALLVASVPLSTDYYFSLCHALVVDFYNYVPWHR